MNEKLVKLRGNRSAASVARDLGISPSTYLGYEYGARTPRDETKIKIADYYGVSVEYLFFDRECHE